MRRLLTYSLLLMLFATSCTAKEQTNSASTAAPVQTAPAAAGNTVVEASPASIHGGSMDGRVLSGGKLPIVNSTVTLYAATGDSPKQLAQTQTDDAGQFSITAGDSQGILYLVAAGGSPKGKSVNNQSIMLMSILGSTLKPHVVIDELTTVASAWTAAQFLNGTALAGNALSLRIAAGNVPNLANVETGGLGSTIQDASNSTETTTLATIGTLGDLVAACVTESVQGACQRLFEAAMPPRGVRPKDTLAVLETIAHNPTWHPDRLLKLFDALYPMPGAPKYPLRSAPYIPYLTYAPSAWILGLKFTGGGIDAPGKLGIDRDGNVWAGDNFIVGDQASVAVWNGNVSKFAPDGSALSPITTGFTGGGVFGPGFGSAIDQKGRFWVSNNQPGASVSIFDKDGHPLTPLDGINFNHQLGALQGILVAPNGDVWILDNEKNQLILFPNGDIAKGRLVCKTVDGRATENPCKLFKAPFHLTMDAQNRIWVSNALAPTVVRFPASDPSKAVAFRTGGFFGKGVAIDSKGNVWVANTAGKGPGEVVGAVLKVVGKITRPTVDEMVEHVFNYLIAHPTGSVSMLRPDGSLGGPFYGGGQSGTWAIAIDGNDNVFISNLIGQNVSELCGVRTQTCPPGLRTGDAISPPGGFVGAGMPMLTDIAIDPAGNVWVADNWRDYRDRCFKQPPEAVSTQCGGNGLTVFYGLAKPVSTPQIGLPHAP